MTRLTAKGRPKRSAVVLPLVAAEAALIQQYLDQLWLEKGVSEHTLAAYGTDLRKFAAFAQSRDLRLVQADSDLLNHYLAHRHDTGLQPRSTARALSSLRNFYQWLHQAQKISENPIASLLNPKLGLSLPKSLSEADVDALLSAPDVNDLIQFRDKVAMSADSLCPLQRERLGVIRQSGEALLAILNDILDLSKIEAGKLELEILEFDLSEVARGAYSAFTAIANKKGLSFALDVQAAHGRYRGDPSRLRQILYNLISNALKFTQSGEVRVTATHREGLLRLTVADTGVGMSPEVLSGLFTPFKQADSSTTRRFGGTGLGLAISRHLAGLMGGALEASSVQGRGSTFTFSLPLPQVKKGRAAAPAVSVTPQTLSVDARALRILAAEDNPTNQLVLKTLLHQAGIEPVLVENGQLAVEAWDAGSFDLLLMDIQMPELDGPAAARAIRRRELETGRARTPIIALTANAMSHQHAQYLEAGMDAIVTKPIDVANLFGAIEAVLGP